MVVGFEKAASENDGGKRMRPFDYDSFECFAVPVQKIERIAGCRIFFHRDSYFSL